MGDGRPSRGLPSLKIRERSDKKWGKNVGLNFRVSNCRIIYLLIADNSYAILNEEDARG